jgi:hypothetical protein
VSHFLVVSIEVAPRSPSRGYLPGCEGWSHLDFIYDFISEGASQPSLKEGADLNF